jgi:hypothetical protein
MATSGLLDEGDGAMGENKVEAEEELRRRSLASWSKAVREVSMSEGSCSKRLMEDSGARDPGEAEPNIDLAGEIRTVGFLFADQAARLILEPESGR